MSVGERVQLLLAVRIAFLEQDERTRVPLLLDEVLGTSDDARAGIRFVDGEKPEKNAAWYIADRRSQVQILWPLFTFAQDAASP